MKNLDEYIVKCTSLFLEELIKSNIIQISKKSKLEKIYFFSDLELNTPTSIPSKANTIPTVIEDFYDFRNILSNVHPHIKGFENQGASQNLNNIFDQFIKVGVINPPWKNEKIIRELFNKAEDVLTEENSRKDAVQALKRNRVSFNPLILKVLEYYSKIQLEDVFNNGKVINPILEDENTKSNTADFIINVPEAGPFITVEVKFRKKRVNLKEIMDQAAAMIRHYEEQVRSRVKCLIILYTYANLNDTERDIFSFKEGILRRPTLRNKTFFVPLPIGHIENLNNKLRELKDEILDRKITYFTFHTQPTPSNKPRLDDHFYEKPIDLTKNNLEVKFRAKLDGHWRFGLRFSNSNNTPSKDERHPVYSPLIHLQKEEESNSISGTLYDQVNQSHHFATSITEYRNEELILKVHTNGNMTQVDIFDSSYKRIIDSSIQMEQQNFCWIFAWADGINLFKFETEIIEYSRASPTTK